MQKNSLSLKNCRYILPFTNGLNESLVTFFMGFNNIYIYSKSPKRRAEGGPARGLPRRDGSGTFKKCQAFLTY